MHHFFFKYIHRWNGTVSVKLSLGQNFLLVDLRTLLLKFLRKMKKKIINFLKKIINFF